VFPQIELDRSHIVYSYSGIRPLPRHEDTAPGFVSRDYRIVDTAIPGLGTTTVLSLVGGKWTTFRALAAHLSTEATTRLGVARRVDTAGMPIGGGKDFPTTDAQRELWIASHRDGLDAGVVEGLLERYGTRAAEVVDVLADGPVEPLESDPSLTRAEVAYFAEHEQAVHLVDVVLRRTNLAFVGGVTIDLLDELADVLAGVLGWTAEERADEVQQTLDTLRESHGVIVPLSSTTAVA
jgi:glycerol-3-phosphate dehydrogenase